MISIGTSGSEEVNFQRVLPMGVSSILVMWPGPFISVSYLFPKEDPNQRTNGPVNAHK